MGSNTELTPDLVLYYAALIIRSNKRKCDGMAIQRLDPKNVCLESEEGLIPEKLYSFVSWLIVSEVSLNPESIKLDDVKVTNPILY